MRLGRFDRERLPCPLVYAKSEDIALRGRGRWLSGACPFCNETLRDPFHLEADSGGFRCHVCQETGGDVLTLHRRLHGLGFVEAARDLGAWVDDDEGDSRVSQPRSQGARRAEAIEQAEQVGREAKRARATAVWSTTEPLVPGMPAAVYLQRRGCPLPPTDGDLRSISRLRLYGFDGPAMVGRISDAADAQRLLGLHLTWLRQDGNGWARGERRYLGAKQGGIVRLWPDEAVCGGLLVGEGIESVLSGARVFTPAWACLDAGNLAQFPVLLGIEALTIAADHDKAGIAAAQACAQRWVEAGREVRIVMAPQAGADLNDYVQEAA